MHRARIHLPTLALGLCASLGLGAQTPIPEATVEVTARKTLAEVAKYYAPELLPEGHQVENLTFRHGNLQLTLKKGVATYLRAGDKPEGLYFKGEGTFSYLATDPIQHPLTTFNMKENSKIVPTKTPGGLQIEEPLTEIALWVGGAELPALTGAAAPAPKEAYAAEEKFFALDDATTPPYENKLVNRLPLGQMFAYRAVNAPTAKVASAQITGAKHHWIYTYDEAWGRLESLMLQSPRSRFGAINSMPTAVVSYQPIGWNRKAPTDPDFRLSHLDVDLVASKKSFATLNLTETLQIIRPNIQVLSLYMKDVTAGRGKLGTWQLRRSDVRRILDENGKELPFDQRESNLLVKLPAPAPNGKTLKLRFEIEGDFLGGDQTSDNYWRLTPGEGWIPEPQGAGQGYTVQAKVAVEKPYVAIVSAKTISRTSNATHNIVEAKLDKPTLWFSIAGGKYESSEMVRNGRTIRAWSYAGVPKGVEPLMKTAHGVLDFYQVLYGNVPFDEINLVEVPQLGFGQAPAGMIWLTREAFDATGDEINRIMASGFGMVGGWVNRMLAHEIGHQYWAHQVKMWGQEDQWLTESFAEYSSALAVRAMKNKGPEVYEQIVKEWESKAKPAAAASPIPLANALSPSHEEEARFRTELVYSKGAFLLACLHKELGEEKFVRFLRTYQKNFAWYPPSYNQDVPDLLKAVSGKDYQPWFDTYFWGTGMPTWKP